MKRRTTIRPKRIMNYGTGDLFNFHGSFTEKAAAVDKEAKILGAFIKTVWYRGGPRYAVLTKNPKGRRNPEWGTYEKGIFHPWTRRPKTRKKKAVRRVRKNARTAKQNSRRKLLKKHRGKRKNTIVWGQPDTDFIRRALRELFPGQKLADVIKDPKRFSKLAMRAEQLKRETKKQNPVIKVPGGWRARSRTGRLSPVYPSRRDAEIAAESMQNPPRARRRNFQERVIEGSRMALIFANEPSGPYWIRLFVNNGETATTAHGKAKTLAGARKIAKKLLDRHIRGNPHGRRRNYADATDLYKKFHGRGPKNVKDTGIPTADYGDHPELGQLGKLVSLTFGDKEAEKPWNKKLIWGSREAPDLAAEPGGRQLYIIGGSQNLNGSLGGLPIDTDKDMLDLGFAYQLEYFSQKSFDNFQPVTYWHDLGETTGEFPRLVYDRVKKRLHIVGGAYTVKPEGIVN